MVGIMGDISGRGPAGGGGEGKAQSYGWDRDLVEVPEVVVVDLEGATEEQAKAALYVDGGALAYDTDLAVAAGAAEDWTAGFRFVGADWFTSPGFLARFELERLSTSGTSLSSANVTGSVKEPDKETGFTAEDATTQGSFRVQIRAGIALYCYTWQNQDYQGTSYDNLIISVDARPLSAGPSDSRARIQLTDATYTGDYGSVEATNPRGASSARIPPDKVHDLMFKLRHYNGDTSRVFGRIHKLDISGELAP